MLTFDANSISATTKSLRAVDTKFKQAALIVSKSAAAQMEAYAKANAKWTDRTGNARQRLRGDAEWVNQALLETFIAHQVDYGIWLELANKRKYAILDEALQSQAQSLFKQYQKLFNK